MMPINWLMSFIFFLFVFMLFNIMNYYMYNFKFNNNISNQKKNKFFNWKW
nr:ATP synthase F0 subunit 8 [Dichorragia nesimachus]